MSKLTIEEAKQIRESVKRVKSLTDMIESYTNIKEELGIDIDIRIEELEEEKRELERGLKYV